MAKKPNIQYGSPNGGVQPSTGNSKPKGVIIAVGAAIAVALADLAAVGIVPRPGRGDDSLLADPAIQRDAYETGRPDAQSACRTGDDRFFPKG